MIPSHKAASWLLIHIDRLLDVLGLEHSKSAEGIIYLIVISVLAVLAGWGLRQIVLFLVRRAVALRHSSVGDDLLRERTLSKCSHFITPLVFLGLIPFAFEASSGAMDVITKAVYIYLLATIAIAVNAVLSFVWLRYDEHENTKKLPLKGILNIGKGIVWGVIVIIAISILVDKSPAALLTGLGAFAAALMLIFKNSILGFVAGIQLSQNDMLRVGDWIIVPSTIANGIVLDVTLSMVKIRNWDNTIVTMPPYNLISGSFQNWRGMQEAGVRQIARSIIFDPTSLLPCDDAMLDGMAEKYPLLKDYIAAMKSQKEVGHEPVFATGDVTVNGTIDTNLGLFRAYAVLYLRNNPHISQEQLIMVRAMAQNSTGVPVQVWCFTNTTVWPEYEAIQSAVFEHLMLVAGDMKLAICDFVEVAIQQQVQASGAISVSK